MSLNFKIIGIRVKESRMRKHISQAELAELIDMSVTYISHIETAKRHASLESLVRIANALEVTVDHFLCGNQTSDCKEYRTDLAVLFEDCNSCEKRILYEIALATKKSLRDNSWIRFKDDQM